jgi:hypothetical protein
MKMLVVLGGEGERESIGWASKDFETAGGIWVGGQGEMDGVKKTRHLLISGQLEGRGAIRTAF